MTADQRAAWKRALATKAAQQRRQWYRPRTSNLQAVSGAGMVRILPPAKRRPAEAGRPHTTEYPMSRKRKPNSGNPRKDQVDASARDAVRQTRAGGPQRNRLDLSQARETDQEHSPPGATALMTRFQKAMTTTRLDACEHVRLVWESGSAVPIHWAAWRPDRAACESCFESWLVPDIAGHATTEYCDLCGSERPTDYMMLASGPVVVHGDLCDECKASPVQGGA